MGAVRLSSTDVMFSQSIETVTSHFKEEGPFESLKEIEAQTIGNLLPDDDDLLCGVIDTFQYNAQPNAGDDMEDFDLFSSGGGLELEADDGLSCYGGSKGAYLYGGIPNDQHGGSNSPFAGEHPDGEHPSRTLFVRNINSNVEDSELRVLFEVFFWLFQIYMLLESFFSFSFQVLSLPSIDDYLLHGMHSAIWRYPCPLYCLQASWFCYNFLL